MLSKLEAFKLGVLTNFADRGLSVEEMRAHVKKANDALDAVANCPAEGETQKQADGFFDAIKSLGTTGAIALALAPPALGAAGGVAHSKLTDVDEDDVETIKRKELADEYRRQAARLRQTKELQQIAKGNAPARGLYL